MSLEDEPNLCLNYAGAHRLLFYTETPLNVRLHYSSHLVLILNDGPGVGKPEPHPSVAWIYQPGLVTSVFYNSCVLWYYSCIYNASRSPPFIPRLLLPSEPLRYSNTRRHAFLIRHLTLPPGPGPWRRSSVLPVARQQELRTWWCQGL